MTYTKPGKDHAPAPDPSDKHITDTKYISWEASDGTTGYIEANDYHSQSYWPEWLPEETLEFTGERLPDNAFDLNGDGSYYVLLMYPWGYADNQPNSTCPGFKIDWAVDSNGDPANLAGIDFVKVVTGIHQRCGALGEASTEVCGAEDLHPEATSVESVAALPFRVSMAGTTLTTINNGAEMEATLHSLSGQALLRLSLPAGRTSHSLQSLPAGLYLLSTPAGTFKIRL